ncbi:MAG TPA: TetR/AcrR family transcriptional regulator C-terminal domain-containing protein [Baekduia sp.]|nr:TetR/AcrR family transcriptional regulator C-terminal domain-containing protein [Baekduia sp.]
MPPATSNPTEPLTADAAVRQALAIADAEGLGALSMRRLAAELGSAPMSLYRHVAGKDELLHLMADHVLAGVPLLAPDEPWPDALMRFFTAMYELLLEHPAVAHIMLERPVRGPNLTERGEALLVVLTEGGVPDPVAAQAIETLTWFTLGGALYAVARGGPDGPRRDRFGDVRPEERPVLHRVREHFAGAAMRDRFHQGLRDLVRGFEHEA